MKEMCNPHEIPRKIARSQRKITTTRTKIATTNKQTNKQAKQKTPLIKTFHYPWNTLQTLSW